jgi:alkylation response protein AidB-like acyl-CoA dehydrogenase
VVQRYIFEEELGYAGAPPLIPFGLAMCAPVLLRFGTEAQKKRFLPRIYQGEDFWCQGYSEPGAGSDLASLKTKARKVQDHYVVNGQKIWTTLAHYADWIFCLVRTDPGADVSMLKIKGTEIQQGLTELMLQAADPAASDAFTQAVRNRYLSMRKTTIYAGSNEIQRNIIAKMTLGL